MSKGKILVVDDSRLSRTLCVDILTEEGFEVEPVSTGLLALDKIRTTDFDLVILDLILPDISGQEIMRMAMQMKASTDFIIMTGHASVDSAVTCLKSGASDYLTKPLNPEEFKIIVNRTIDQKRLYEENAGLKRLVKLYDLSRVISSCLDYQRFYEVIIDSFLQMVEGKVGLSIFLTGKQAEWELKAFRGGSEEEAARLSEALIPYLRKTASETGDPNIKQDVLNLKPDAIGIETPDLGPFLLIPIRKKDVVAGYVAIFNSPGKSYGNTDAENAAFVSTEASLALENVELYGRARELTYIDDLTKLHNLRYLDIVLTNEIKRAKRFNSYLSLLFIDIDYFKNINDTYGHRVGSKALAELGQILKDTVREIDVVVRYGGDEFTILLIETNSAGAAIIAERIRTEVEEHIFLAEEGLSISLTITTGVATYPESAADKEELLTMADNAMYRGKRTTRDVVILAEESNHKKSS